MPHTPPAPLTPTMEVSDPGYVRLRSFTAAGAIDQDLLLALRPGSRVQEYLLGIQAPIISIGPAGRDTHPITSTHTFEGASGGMLLLDEDPGRTNRCAFATTDIRYTKQVTLPKLKTERVSPVAAAVPRGGIVYSNAPYVVFDQDLRRWTESTASWTATLGTLAAVPAGEPWLWGSFVYWPVGASGVNRYDGALLVQYTNATINGIVGAVIYNDRCYFVKSTGEVYKTNAADYTFTTLTLVGKVDDAPTGMLLFPNADNKLVPHVIGKRRLYVVDETAGLIFPAGPPPLISRFPLRADVLSADLAVYLAYGSTIIQWNGDVAQSMGLDSDHGLPAAFRGGIQKLLNGGLSLYALMDATAVITTGYSFGPPTGPDGAGVLRTAQGYSALFSREATAWVTRAISEATALAPSMLFVSDANTTYRLWFAWDKKVYTIDLEEGLFNPLDDPSGRFESLAYIEYPRMTFQHLEQQKTGLECNIRVRNITATRNWVKVFIAFDRGGWHLLGTIDGEAVTNNQDGRYTFPITASPGVSTEWPPVGFPHDMAQIRLEMGNDGITTTTPVVDFVDFHVRVVVDPVTAFQLVLDLSHRVADLEPWQQYQALQAILDAQRTRMVHFAHLRGDEVHTDEAYPDVRAVFVRNYSGVYLSGGLPANFDGLVTLDLAEAIGAY